MGCSRHSEFFCKSTTTMLFSEAKEKVKNYFEKIGLNNTGASMRACFILSNDDLASAVHLTS